MPEKSTPYTYHAYHLEDISDAGDVDRFLDYLSNDLRDRLKEWLEKTAL